MTVFICAIVASIFACGGVARAALHVCNGTYEPATVALAVLTQGTSGAPQVRSIGWWQIDVATCETIVGPDLDPTAFYYLYAKSRSITWAGNPGKASRDAAICTSASGFNYVDRQSNLCTGAAQQMLWFINEPITGPDWTIRLDLPT